MILEEINMTKEKIKVGIMGFGVVGTGTYKVLTENSEMIKSQKIGRAHV